VGQRVAGCRWLSLAVAGWRKRERSARCDLGLCNGLRRTASRCVDSDRSYNQQVGGSSPSAPTRCRKHNVSSGQRQLFVSRRSGRFVSLFKPSSVRLGPASTRRVFRTPVGPAVANIVRLPSQSRLADPHAQPALPARVMRIHFAAGTSNYGRHGREETNPRSVLRSQMPCRSASWFRRGVLFASCPRRR
jgi:hypothetical protein